MTILQTYLLETLIITELICALTALLFHKKLKNTYWKWFVYYIVMVFLFDTFGKWGFESNQDFKKHYYNFLVIPFQFIFLYWLYAYKSLKQPKLFWLFGLIYTISFYIILYFDIEKTRIINMLSYTIATLLLFILVTLEFLKQIKSDDILDFKQSKMFYINLGVALFYVGTLPFFAFDGYSVVHTKKIWMNYWTVFLFLNNLLYLIFAASFVWGKPKESD